MLPEDAARHLGKYGAETSGPIGAGQARLRRVHDAPQIQQEESPRDGHGKRTSVKHLDYPVGIGSRTEGSDAVSAATPTTTC